MSARDRITGFRLDHGEWKVGRLANPMPVFSAATTCAQTYEWFDQHSHQVAAAIVDESNHAIGIVNRLRFLARYARRFVPELYAKHSIMKLANANPFVVDENVPLVELGSMLTLDWPDALRECFVMMTRQRCTGQIEVGYVPGFNTLKLFRVDVSVVSLPDGNDVVAAKFPLAESEPIPAPAAQACQAS